MRDPNPENISGEKRHSFSWNVEVDVGQLALGIALLYLVWKGAQLLSAEGNDEEDGEFTGR